MKVAVTGATGFIGRHVLRELAAQNLEVVALVRPSSSADIQGLPVSKVLKIDLHEPSDNLFEQMGQPDVLIHLAWGGLPNYNSLHHFETELPAHFRFLKQLVNSGLKHLLVAGTCFEYGMQSGPLSINTEPKPINPYGFAKDSLRRELQFLQKQYPFSLTWARIFYLFGQGQSETSLYSQLTNAVERREKVFNMSGGEQLRDYQNVVEASRQLVKLALKENSSELVNICSGKPTSVRSLVEEWIETNSWEIKLNLGYYPYSDFEPMAFWGILD